MMYFWGGVVDFWGASCKIPGSKYKKEGDGPDPGISLAKPTQSKPTAEEGRNINGKAHCLLWLMRAKEKAP